MNRPRLLDLFCGAGGASMGYARAGFEVVGVDIAPQKNYPFTFFQADALTFPLDGFDAIHASPPCEAFSKMTPLELRRNGTHPQLIELARARLRAAGRPYVIENVRGARLQDAVMLCGSMFGLFAGETYRCLCGYFFDPAYGKYGCPNCNGECGPALAWSRYQLQRHRYFEASFDFWAPASCAHTRRALGVYGHSGGVSRRDGIAFARSALWAEGMEIDWMNRDELAEALPPAYTKYIGGKLLAAIEGSCYEEAAS